jgi:ribosomal-protein-alanine N-acetyltransferase
MLIETQSLLITEMTSADIIDIHGMNSYPEVAKFNTIGIPKDISVTQKVCQPVLEDQKKTERTNYGWIIKSKDSLEFVGEIGMRLSSKKYSKGELHYSLLPSQWGNGFATEAVQAIINFGFNELQLHRITAGTAVDNIASTKVLEKVGMTREGHCRKILPLKSGWADNYEYAILEEDKRDY